MKTNIVATLICGACIFTGCEKSPAPANPERSDDQETVQPAESSAPLQAETPAPQKGDPTELVDKITAMTRITKEDGKGYIIQVDFREKTVSTEDLEELKKLQKLESILCTGSNISDGELKVIGEIKGLKNLDLRGCKVSNKGLAHLVNLSELKALRLSGSSGVTTVDDDGMQYIGKLTNLKALLLDFLWISGEGLAQLKELSTLEELYLASTLVGDEDLQQLALFPNLKKLRISKLANVTGAGLAHVKQLEHLIDLDLSENSSLFDTDLEQIAGMTSLQRLNLWRVGLTDAGVAHLAGMVEMDWLNLDNTQLSDAGLASLKEMQKLTFLHLGSTLITDAGIPALTGLKSLKELKMTRTSVTETGVKELKVSLPNTDIQLKYLGNEN